jgi:hypothetical protein
MGSPHRRTWTAETALPGWGERTGNRKSYFREAVETLGKCSLVHRTLVGPETFRQRAATKIVEMTSAGSNPLSPASCGS